MIGKTGLLLRCLISESFFRNSLIPIIVSSFMLLSQNLKWLFPLATTASILMLFFRARVIYRTLKEGIEVPGKYIKCERDSRTRGNLITYSFSHGGHLYEAVSRPLDRGVPFEEGQKVTVIMSSLNPSLSLIKDLYVKRGHSDV